MTTITYQGGPTITPLMALLGSADAEVTSRTVTHQVLDGPPVHTLRDTSPRSHTLALLFATVAEAQAALNALTAPAVFTMAGAEDPALNRRFVVRSVRLEQDEATRTATVLRVVSEAAS